MRFVDMGLPLIVVGIVLFFGLLHYIRRSRQRRRSTRLLITTLFSILIIGFALVGSALYWYTHRPRPPDLQKQLYEGVMYYRDVRSEPRPVIIHIIAIDLNVADVSFIVTEGDMNADRPYRAQTTSDFLKEYGVQIAINGDFIEPWERSTLWGFSPDSGVPIDVSGMSSSNGVVYSADYRRHHSLYISQDQIPSFDAPPLEDIYNAISGNIIFVENGQYVPFHAKLDPRTAIALDASEDLLLLIVVDGSQPYYSEGLTIRELADVIIDYGGHTALNLDGGGSSVMVIEGQDGKPEMLNSPINDRIPGNERPVGNHLGIYVE